MASNGEVEGPRDHAGQATRAHNLLPRPRSQTRSASRPLQRLLDTATLLAKFGYIERQSLFPGAYGFIKTRFRPPRICLDLLGKGQMNAGKYISFVRKGKQKVILILAPPDRRDMLSE